MKNFLLLTTAIFFLFNDVNAQLVADAGPDQTLVDCPGASLVLGGTPTASGGAGPYTYAWFPTNGLSDPTAANPIVSNIGFSTTYAVTVFDAIGDSATDVVFVSVVPNTILANAGFDATICQGGCATLGGSPTATGGGAPYMFSWTGPMGFTSSAANPTVCPTFTSTYNLTVTDGNGCTAGDAVVFTVSGPNVSIAPPAQLTCAVTSVALTASSISAIAFQWSNGATTSSIVVSAAGSYSVTATDASGCTSSAAVSVSQLIAPPNVSIAPPAQLNCAVTSVTLTASSTTSGVIYNWGGGVTTSTTTVSFPGTYTVTVTDPAGGCTASAAVTVSQNIALPNVSIATPAQLTCTVTSVTLTASSSTIGATYDWGGGVTSVTQTVFAPGNYSVTVTDPNNNCSATASTLVFRNCGIFSIQAQDILCNGACDGSASVLPAGNYTYVWNNTATTSTVTGLCAGIYSVTVMDSVLTPLDSLNISINQPTPLTVGNMFVSNPRCFGSSDGSVDITVSGGTPPYTFNWALGTTTEDATNLMAGTYPLTVTDNNNCTASVTAVLVEPTLLTAATSVVNESSPGACNGSILLTVTGGVGGYTFAWSNGATTSNLNNLCAGTYTATITDMNACTASATGTVTNTCTVNTLVLSIDSTGHLDCTRFADTLTAVVSGGTQPYNYTWYRGGLVDTTASIIVTQPGSVLLFVTDSAGCSRQTNHVVLNTGIGVTIQSAVPASCNGAANGKIKAAASGGTAPYTYLWSNGATADSVINLPAGTYRLTVTDATSCSASISYFLNQVTTNWSYYIYTNSTYANCGNNGTATVTVYGGTGPFTYLWNTTPPQTTQTATNLAMGYYNVTVTGSDGCMRSGNTYVYNNCYNIIRGRLIHDLNGNCVLDSGETIRAYQSIVADGTTDSYGYTDAQGYYSIHVLSGTYNIRPYLNGTCVINCSGLNTSYNHTFSSLGDTLSNINFYLVPAPFDLFVSNGWSGFRPGFTQAIPIYYGNTGINTVNGTLTFSYDADLVYQSSSDNGVHNATNRTVTWILTGILPSGNINYNTFVTATFLTPVGTPLNTPIINGTRITGPANECDTTDNVYVASTFVRNSYDPNDKAVSPEGDIFEEDSMLTYTIRFQNTGNDTAWFVILKDTLSSYLEPGSVENLASSHPITEFRIEGEGILTWVFNPIYLVDSFTNEPASHGYVVFRVKKRSGLPLSTTISNTAHIYFDYNEPVVTNTVTNTLTEPNFIFTVRGDDNISVMAMPNPFTQQTQIVVEGINSAFDFELFDVTGKVMRKISSDTENRFELQRDDMSAGVYFYRITTTQKQRAFGRVVVE